MSKALVDYLGGLKLVGGDHDGQPFTVLPWERRFIFGAFRTRGAAALSVARGNGKSALVGAIATAVVDPAGPLHGNRRECICVAASFQQSRIIFEDVLSFLGQRYDIKKRDTWRLQDSANSATVEFRPSGARVRCFGSDPSKAHGLRPYLALLDEPAQWDGHKSARMYAAMRTSLGKQPNSKLIALGTRPELDDHWFSVLLAGGASYSQNHTTDKDDPPFHRRTWNKANPSLSHLPSLLAELQDEARIARKDPALLASFRSLRLNQGVSDVLRSLLLDAGLWESIEGDVPPTGRPVWGVDLGTSAAQSAVAAYWPSGRLAALAAFPTVPGLAERGLRDGCGRLYQDCADRGELIQCGGNAVSVHALLQAALDRFGPPTALASDRWRESELRDALTAAGVPSASLELRGMGYKDGGEDVRFFRRACAEGKVTPVRSLLMTAAMSEARTIGDPAGNHKLAKNTEGGRRGMARDDAAAAAILAVSLGARRHAKPAGGGYLGSVSAG